MPLFDYTGQLQSGAAFRGTLEATSNAHAEAMLRDMGVRVTALRPAKTAAYVAPLSLDDFLFFNEQIAAVTRAGLPLGEGLRSLAGDVGSRKLKRVILELAEAVESGEALPAALERLNSRFPTEYAGVVRAGLATGDLGASLYGLTAHLRLKGHFQRALAEVAVYPLVIIVFTFLMLSFIMRTIAPAVEDTLNDFGVKQLPFLAETIFGMARIWPSIELALLVVIAAIVLAWMFLALPVGRGLRERVLRFLPGVAQVYSSSVLARFTHASALAAFVGMPLPKLIISAGRASGSFTLQRACESVAAKLESGQTLTQATAAQRAIPALWSCIVATAGPRGELPAALEELARSYESRARQSASTVRIILAPILLLIVGTLLGGLVLGIIMPMISLVQSLTN